MGFSPSRDSTLFPGPTLLLHHLATHADVGPFSRELTASITPKSLGQHLYPSQQLGPQTCGDGRHNALRPLVHKFIDALAHLAAAWSNSDRGSPAVRAGSANALD